jgi:sec-independent protein translocase protein TatA
MNLAVFMPLFLSNMRGWQFIIVVMLVLLLFGGKKIPELMRGLGRGVHEFKQGMEEAKREMNKPLDTDTDAADHKPEQPKAKDID